MKRLLLAAPFLLAVPAQAADLGYHHRHTATRQVVVKQHYPPPVERWYPVAGRPTEITYVTRPMVVRTVDEVEGRRVLRARY